MQASSAWKVQAASDIRMVWQVLSLVIPEPLRQFIVANPSAWAFALDNKTAWAFSLEDKTAWAFSLEKGDDPLP
jgi:hypothetical protein